MGEDYLDAWGKAGEIETGLLASYSKMEKLGRTTDRLPLSTASKKTIVSRALHFVSIHR
jgi:hypothetical protein